MLITMLYGCRNWALEELRELPRLIGTFKSTIFWVLLYCARFHCTPNTKHLKNELQFSAPVCSGSFLF
jgi:hypothetical protein